MARRKHRRVRKSWAGCRCPKGSRKISTKDKVTGKKRGRGWGCLGVGPSQKGKPSPRFVAAICGEPKLLPPPRKVLLLTAGA